MYIKTVENGGENIDVKVFYITEIYMLLPKRGEYTQGKRPQFFKRGESSHKKTYQFAKGGEKSQSKSGEYSRRKRGGFGDKI